MGKAFASLATRRSAKTGDEVRRNLSCVVLALLGWSIETVPTFPGDQQTDRVRCEWVRGDTTVEASCDDFPPKVSIAFCCLSRYQRRGWSDVILVLLPGWD
jgi:hypothetical protein